MKITVNSIGTYDFTPKVIKVANGYVCKIDKNGEVTSTWDERKEIKVYNNSKDLLEDVSILINNEDIFTVEPVININLDHDEKNAEA